MPENNNNVSNENVFALPDTGVLTDIKFGNNTYEIGLGSTTREAIENEFSALQTVIDDNEEIVSSALNDLEERKVNKSELSDFVEKSTTQGLLRNDGSVDTNTYLTQHQDLSAYFNDVAYDSQTKHINFKNGTTINAYIDATDFIKDGMVSNVEVATPESGDKAGVQCLIISFNTDAGKSPIEIPLYDIFDSDEYYTKDEIDVADRVVSSALNDLNTTKANIDDLALVATSGSYNDLLNKPTVPSVINSVTENSTDAVTSGAVWTELQSYDCGEY